MKIDFDELYRTGMKDTRTVSSGEIRWLLKEVASIKKAGIHQMRFCVKTGDRIENVAAQMCEEARRFSCNVVAEFNGVKLEATPEMSPKVLEEQFWRKLKTLALNGEET